MHANTGAAGPVPAHRTVREREEGVELAGCGRAPAVTVAVAVLGVLIGTAGAREAGRVVGLRLEPVAEGLTAPVDLVEPEDGSGRKFVADQAGLVHVLGADGRRLRAPFLDLRDRVTPLLQGFDERGLLGFALHPEFARNGRFFVTYSHPLREAAPAGWNHTRRVSEFAVSADDPNRADPGSERVLLELDWPSRKHNGGGLAFGLDGLLYVGLGDGGAVHGVGKEVLHEAFEVPEAMHRWDRLAQDTSSLYGKILRLDVDHGFPGYAIPPLNPLKGVEPGRDEIYAWGLRNPYRFSFDPEGGGLFVTAVGETLWESIYLVDRPGNYGWAVREGRHCFDRRRPTAPPEACATAGPYGEPLIDPVIEYANMSVERDGVTVGRPGVGTAVVGGHLYRGAALPGLRGKFVFGDWSREFMRPSGQLFVASPPAEWGAAWRIERERGRGPGRDACRRGPAPSGNVPGRRGGGGANRRASRRSRVTRVRRARMASSNSIMA